MGDAKNDDLRVSFDSRLKLKFLGSQITTDAGLLAYRELDEALGLTEMADDLLGDSRLGSNKQHRLLPLLRQSIYSRLAGYEDVNDAERLSVDPAMRQVVGGRAALTDKHAASAKAESSGTASSWAALVKRVFEVDPLECPQCGSRMKVVSFIERSQRDIVENILRHCGLWEGPLRTLATARAPPKAGDSDRDPAEPRELELVLDPEYL